MPDAQGLPTPQEMEIGVLREWLRQIGVRARYLSEESIDFRDIGSIGVAEEFAAIADDCDKALAGEDPEPDVEEPTVGNEVI